MNTEIIVPFLIETLAKSVLILSAAALIDRAWVRASAAQRHLVWCAAFAAVLLLPVTRVFEPRWNVPLQRVSVELPQPKVVELPVMESAPIVDLTAPHAPATPRWRWPDWQHTTFFIWSAGAGLLLLTRLLGSIRLVVLRRTTHPLLDARVQQLAAETFRELGIRRRVELRLSSTGCVPLTWGTWRPVLMLPAEALAWSDARLTAALRHEAGHIARGDHFTRWIAYLACALYWPNPLAWLAARRLRIAQEQATDDLVLRAGSAPDEYAAQLFEVARTLAARRGLAQCAVAMASSSTLERRMLAIVDDRRDRRPLTLRALAGGVFAVALTFGLATAAQLQAQEKKAPSTTDQAGGPGKQQIMIEAKFVEVTTSEGEPNAISQWLTGVLTAGQAKTADAPEASSSTEGRAFPGIVSISGIITPEQNSTMLRALSQKKGVDLMATPRVTTLSGQPASIEIARDFRYPTEWNKEGEKWVPKTFETRKVGVTLGAQADANADGTIDLQVTPTVTEFQGFIDLDGDQNPPPDPADTITRRDQAGRVLQNDQPGRRMQPVFSERKLTTAVSIFPGQTVVMGGMKDGAGTTFAGAPAGAKKKLHRQLVVFVTVDLVKEKPAPVPAVPPKPEPQSAVDVSSGGESVALVRARKIILPKIEFRDATVTEALALLTQKSREFDEEKKGVHLMARPGAGDGVKITLSLANVPLIEAANYVAQLANLKFVAEGVSLIFLPADKSDQTKPAPPKPKAEEDPKSAPAKSAALDKAAKIILPRVELREATVAEAVAFLRAKSIELDAEKTGVNVMLAPGAAADARLSLNLTNVPLSEALRYVAGLSNLELIAEPYAIMLRGPKEEAAPSQAKAAEGNQSLVVTSDEATFDQKRNVAEFKGNVEIKQGNNVITGERMKIQVAPAALLTKVWKVTGESLRRALGTDESTGAIKAALIERQVAFPEGSTLAWLPESERIVMRNTQENLMRLEGLIEKAVGQEAR